MTFRMFLCPSRGSWCWSAGWWRKARVPCSLYEWCGLCERHWWWVIMGRTVPEYRRARIITHHSSGAIASSFLPVSVLPHSMDHNTQRNRICYYEFLWKHNKLKMVNPQTVYEKAEEWKKNGYVVVQRFIFCLKELLQAPLRSNWPLNLIFKNH